MFLRSNCKTKPHFIVKKGARQVCRWVFYAVRGFCDYSLCHFLFSQIIRKANVGWEKKLSGENGELALSEYGGYNISQNEEGGARTGEEKNRRGELIGDWLVRCSTNGRC
jgi:hypothetical protein